MESAPATATGASGLLGHAVGVYTDGRTFRNLVYLAVSIPLAGVYVLILFLGGLAGGVLSVVGIGLLLLVGVGAAAWGFIHFERDLANTLLQADIPGPIPAEPGQKVRRRLRAALTRGATWRALAYLAIKVPFGIAAGVLLAGILVAGFGAVRGLVASAGPADVMAVPGQLAGVAGYLFCLTVALMAVNAAAPSWARFAAAMLGDEESRQLRDASRRAEQADRSRRELIVNVSHDLRTPIASIQAHVDPLLRPAAERPPPEEAERYLRTISEENRRMAGLVDDLLVLARADSQELTVRRVSVSLAGASAQVVGALAALARDERGVTLAQSHAAGVSAWADPDRLQQVLGNLVRNAINHTPEGGAVMLESGRAGPGRVFVSVSDTGVGIAPEDLGRIFERFYRTDESRSRDTGGFGLGLSVSRDLLAAMGGGITVTSEPGIGSTFRVELPSAA